MSPLRIGLLGVAILLAIVGAWMYMSQASSTETYKFWIAVVCFVAAGGSALGFFLTRPEERAEDISITKF
ncbi:hypothetical protein J8C02_01105 [Chloracidobacterium sp. MS 40/45]|jgi:hypothetical protein|uniref:hypothetical protein n=1 Tax=Chloracidobacterium aggregatum TaxID=2851959 RepID=UPI001B8B7C27|nr:hypothetical protein [Chloracidobacterium aggregatum]QUW00151.1 hypothetical protein J8C02_01105 [Chloracidobacterium sp. MS 40/45]